MSTGFFLKPNLPDRPAKGVIIDCRAGEEAVEKLRGLGVEPVPSFHSEKLAEAVCTHPDMTILHLGGDEFICAPDAADYYENVLHPARIKRGKAEQGLMYPEDIPYNIALLGELAFLNEKTAQAEIEHGRKTVHVRQGYVKCNVCVITENAVITSDTGIWRAARENGVDALLISAGHIELPGMNYGFIGGAAGLIAPDTLAVNGDISTHPDADKITAFCARHGVKITALRQGALIDIGSILPIF